MCYKNRGILFRHHQSASCALFRTKPNSSHAAHTRLSDQFVTSSNSHNVVLASLQQTVIPTYNSDMSQNLCYVPPSCYTILCVPFWTTFRLLPDKPQTSLTDWKRVSIATTVVIIVIIIIKPQNFSGPCHACLVFNTIFSGACYQIATPISWQYYSPWTVTRNNLCKRPVG
jgi:hypothetical protein